MSAKPKNSNSGKSKQWLPHVRYHRAVHTLIAAQLIVTLVAIAVELLWTNDGRFFYAVSILFPVFGILAGFLELKRSDITSIDDRIIAGVGNVRGFDLLKQKEFREVFIVKMFYRFLFFALSGLGYVVRLLLMQVR